MNCHKSHVMLIIYIFLKKCRIQSKVHNSSTFYNKLNYRSNQNVYLYFESITLPLNFQNDRIKTLNYQQCK